MLISKLEEKRSLELKALEANIDEGKSRIRTLKTNVSKGWFGHLEDCVSAGSVSSGHLAVKSAPFFADVPPASLGTPQRPYSLEPSFPQSSSQGS